jgi:hypothetical protein
MIPAVEASDSWHELISGMDPAATFATPATEEQLASAEKRLGTQLPAELRALLAETDGVLGQHGLGLVWSVDRIVAENMRLRDDDSLGSLMALSSLLFFADAGDGELFAHPVGRAGVARGLVFVWNPIEDSRIRVAECLGDYLSGWLSGSLTI